MLIQGPHCWQLARKSLDLIVSLLRERKEGKLDVFLIILDERGTFDVELISQMNQAENIQYSYLTNLPGQKEHSEPQHHFSIPGPKFDRFNEISFPVDFIERYRKEQGELKEFECGLSIRGGPSGWLKRINTRGKYTSSYLASPKAYSHHVNQAAAYRLLTYNPALQQTPALRRQHILDAQVPSHCMTGLGHNQLDRVGQTTPSSTCRTPSLGSPCW